MTTWRPGGIVKSVQLAWPNTGSIFPVKHDELKPLRADRSASTKMGVLGVVLRPTIGVPLMLTVGVPLIPTFHAPVCVAATVPVTGNGSGPSMVTDGPPAAVA